MKFGSLRLYCFVVRVLEFGDSSDYGPMKVATDHEVL